MVVAEARDGGIRRVGALDGVRGLAVVAVVAFHAFPGIVPGGFFGVESFFVLSGFLLTRLLLAEHARTGGIDIGGFARRRLRRIVPALWLVLVVIVVVAPVAARADAHRLPADVGWSALGLTNWHLVAEQSSYFAQLGRPPLVRHLWSIAVEVQFYLVCPFLALWVARRRRRTAMAALAAGVAASAALMAVLADGADPSRAYYGTDTRVGALLSGALLALVLHGMPAAGRDRLRGLADPVAALGVVVLVGLCWRGREGMQALYPLGFLAVQAATAAVITGAVAGAASASVLAAAPLRWLGERSYGIYLWHWPLVALVRPGIDVDWSPAVAGLAGVAGAVVLGSLSYTYVERPLLGRARPRLPVLRPARPLALASAALLVGGVAGVMVHLPTNDPIAETLRAGEMILSLQPAGPPATVTAATTTTAPMAAPTTTRPPPAPSTSARAKPAPAPAPVRAPTTAPRPPVTLRPGPPPGAISVTAIGDSVMLSAAGPLTARLGPSGAIDAKVSRQFREGVAIVSTLRQEGRLAPVVVVHLGTNGPPTPADVDAMMGAAGTSRVLLLTVRVRRAWSAETNAVLAAAPARHPTATLVDWSGHSEGHGDWFHSDGIHLTAAGAAAYAALIGSMLPAPAPAPAPPPPPTSTAPTTTPR